MKHVILIFEKLPGGIFQKNILEGGAEVSLMIGLLIGIMVGVLLSRFIFREKPVGSLRVDESASLIYPFTSWPKEAWVIKRRNNINL